MKKWLFLSVAFVGIVFSFQSLRSKSPYQYELAACTMFKNEAPWLKEWLVYHHDVLGIEHFYLYKNDSSDHYTEVLEPFIKQGIVELIEWNSGDLNRCFQPAQTDPPFVAYQLGAFNDCLRNRALGKAKWVAVIDLDEYIVPAKGVASFHALLKRAEKKKRGSVKMFWRVFGTSHVYDLGQEELLTERLTYRNEDEHEWNRLTKSIHRPEAVKFCMVHEAESLQPGYKFQTLSPDKVRIQHYWARTEKFCLDRRGFANLEDLNHKEDTTILQYIPALRSFMKTRE